MKDNNAQWGKIVSKIIKAELAKRGINYPELVERLNAQGISDIKVDDLRARLSRGNFSAALFIQCLRAIGVVNLSLENSLFEESSKES
ncbi:MAG: DUF6471 domain-containing protein [Legionellales bacterium]|jgi:hypothetical protein